MLLVEVKVRIPLGANCCKPLSGSYQNTNNVRSYPINASVIFRKVQDLPNSAWHLHDLILQRLEPEGLPVGPEQMFCQK